MEFCAYGSSSSVAAAVVRKAYHWGELVNLDFELRIYFERFKLSNLESSSAQRSRLRRFHSRATPPLARSGSRLINVVTYRRTTMFRVFAFLQIVAAFLSITNAQLHPSAPARYVPLPSLRDQAAIVDNWRDERLAKIPGLLNKYNIDAWLVSLFMRPVPSQMTLLMRTGH